MEGFDTFMSSLTNKSFQPAKSGSGVDLVLSCVDNYEARMVVNQVSKYLLPKIRINGQCAFSSLNSSVWKYLKTCSFHKYPSTSLICIK